MCSGPPERPTGRPAPTGMCCSDEQMRAEVYGIRQRGATRPANGGPPDAGKVPSSLREVDAHSSEEAAEPKFDLGTFALVAPDALLELLIRTLEAGQPRCQRVIAAVDLVLAG